MTEIVHASEITDVASIAPYLTDVPKAYASFQESEGIPAHSGLYYHDLNDLETGPWDRTGQNGAFVNLYGSNGTTDLHIHELDPGGETRVQRHFYEEIVYVSRGSGATQIGEDQESIFEWEEDALFFIPPNVPYKHVNLTDEPTRLIAQTPLPQILGVYRNTDLLFGNTWDSELDDDYYSSAGELYDVWDTHAWSANFIPDLRAFEKLNARKSMGAHRTVLLFHSQSCMAGHLAETPPGLYKKAHRHGPGAAVFILEGEGYGLLWYEGMDKKIKVDLQPGTIVIPPARWYHHYFDTGNEGLRMFAIHGLDLGTLGEEGNPVFYNAHPDNVIGYHEEEPIIRDHFEEELARKGLESQMPEECYTNPEYEFKI